MAAPRPLKPAELAAALGKKKPERRYLFTGEEQGEKDKYIGQIIQLLVTDRQTRTHAVARFYLGTDDLAAAIDFALSPSMFSSATVCVLHAVDELAADAGTMLCDMLVELPESSAVIMTAAGNHAPRFLSPERIPGLIVVQFWRHFANDLQSYASQALRKRGLSLSAAMISSLLALTGRDIKKIDDAVERLAAGGITGEITDDQIRDLLHDEHETSVFEFIDLFFMRQQKCFPALFALLEDGVHPLVILSLIIKKAETLERFHHLRASGHSVEEALSALKIKDRERDFFLRMSAASSAPELRRLFPLLHAADYGLKSGGSGAAMIANPLTGLALEYLTG